MNLNNYFEADNKTHFIERVINNEYYEMSDFVREDPIIFCSTEQNSNNLWKSNNQSTGVTELENFLVQNSSIKYVELMTTFIQSEGGAKLANILLNNSTIEFIM